MAKNPAISLRSRWLAEKLKAARREAGYSLVEAGEYTQLDHSTIARFERGTHKIRRAYVRELLDFYGVAEDRKREYLLQLADDAWRKDRWDGDSHDLAVGFIDLTWLESMAVKINVFEPLLIHGLLQTEDYMRALARLEQDKKANDPIVNRVVEVRKLRQSIITGDKPTQVSAIIEEPAIRRPIGGKRVMKGQLMHLIELAQADHIEIRVMSVTASADPGHHGPFAYFEMPDPYPEIAFVENLAGSTFFEKESTVDVFRHTYDELERLALSTQKSVTLMHNVLKDLE